MIRTSGEGRFMDDEESRAAARREILDCGTGPSFLSSERST
jgi:hypothetical protein